MKTRSALLRAPLLLLSTLLAASVQAQSTPTFYTTNGLKNNNGSLAKR